MSIRVYDHYSQALTWEWPNFTAAELACSHCGALKVDVEALDKLQNARREYGQSVRTISAYRCPQHPIEAKKRTPGSHSTGSAFDVKPYDDSPEAMQRWYACLNHQGLHRQGFALSLFLTGRGQFHVDWDMNKQSAVWFYPDPER